MPSTSCAASRPEARNRLQEKVREAHERLDREQAQASTSTWDAGSFHRRLGHRFHAGAENRSARRTWAEAAGAGQGCKPWRERRGDVGKAGADLDAALEKFTNLEIEIQEEIAIQGERQPRAAQGGANRAGSQEG